MALFSTAMIVRRTTIILVGCLSVLVGLGLARKVNFILPIWSILFIPPSFLLLKSKNLLSLFLVIIFGLSLGLWRGSVYMQKLGELKGLSDQRVTIEAVATSDSVYGDKSQIEFTANHANLIQPANKTLAGSFKISGFGEPMVYRGDRVQVSGKLYPMRGSNQARIAYAQLKKTGQGSSPINKLTRHFAAGMQSALPEPQSSFALGILIGQRSNLAQEIITQMTMVGLVHIVAVSGYNLTILVRAATKLKLRSKYQQLILSLLLIGIFLLITGFAASIVRAALVSALSLWAWFYGRKIRPVLLISFVAALTALVNPFYIWGDLGWYLSFLAFFGILIIAPLVSKRLFSRQPKMLTMVVLETMAAEVMTLPLIMMTFGQLSLVALLANAIIVPLVPIAMLLGAVAGTAGALIPSLAGWLAWPASLLLGFMLDVVRVLSSIPSVFMHIKISLLTMLGFYTGVILVVIILQHQLKQRNLKSKAT